MAVAVAVYSPSLSLACGVTPSHFLSTCQAGGGEEHRREVSVSPEPQTFLAWVRSQKLPPSRNLSCLSSRLAQHPKVGQLA